MPSRVYRKLVRDTNMIFLDEVNQAGIPEPFTVRQRSSSAKSLTFDQGISPVGTIKLIHEVGTHGVSQD
jgi:hypothetical protein